MKTKKPSVQTEQNNDLNESLLTNHQGKDVKKFLKSKLVLIMFLGILILGISFYFPNKNNDIFYKAYKAEAEYAEFSPPPPPPPLPPLPPSSDSEDSKDTPSLCNSFTLNFVTYKDNKFHYCDGSKWIAITTETGAENTTKIINIAAIDGVTAPVANATPVTSITAKEQYTGTVTWNGNPTTFAANTIYTATITLTPKTGYTLTGVAADFFTVTGTTNDANLINSGVITAAFPATGKGTENSNLTPEEVVEELDNIEEIIFDTDDTDDTDDTKCLKVKYGVKNGYTDYSATIGLTKEKCEACLGTYSTTTENGETIAWCIGDLAKREKAKKAITDTITDDEECSQINIDEKAGTVEVGSATPLTERECYICEGEWEYTTFLSCRL